MRAGTRFGLGVAVAAGLWLPVGAQAQDGEGQQELNSLTVIKVVDGDVPEGTTFDVEINCDTRSDSAPEGGPTTQTLTFEAEGGSQTVTVPQFDAECRVSETDNGGADSVTYEAEFTGKCSPSTDEDGATLLYTNTFGSTCTVTVTNTFPEAQPDDVVQEPPAADIVTAQPAFTG